MNKTLLSLFEQNEQDFRDELSRISWDGMRRQSRGRSAFAQDHRQSR